MISFLKAKVLFIPTILIFFLIPTQISAQNFKFLTNSDGLSNSSINVIYQDTMDLMWFGTWDGLNQYNGREIEVFKPTLNTEKGQINNNIIRDIVEIKKGEIWISTDNGISRYTHNSKEFKNFFVENKSFKIFRENSFFIAKNDKNQLFAAIYNVGLFYYSEELDDFLLIEGFEHKLMKKIFFDSQNRLWCVSEKNELYKIELAKNREDEYIFYASEKVNLANHALAVFYDTASNQIWIQDDNYDVYYQDAGNAVIQKFPILLKERISSLLLDNGFCYIGTGNKLIKFDLTTNQTSVEINNPIRCIYKGKQNILWVGTDGQGIIALTPDYKKFIPYALKTESPEPKLNPIRCFWENNNGELYIGTKGSGLFLVSPDNKIQKHVEVKDGLISNSIYTLAGNSSNEICWLGTDLKGIQYIDLNKNKLYNLTGLPDELQNISVYAIYLQSDSVLWVGSYGNGLYKVTIDTESFPYKFLSHKKFIYQEDKKNSISSNNIFSIIPHSNDNLFIGTRGGGLNYFNIKTEKFENITNGFTAGGNDILSIHKSNDSILWIGTSMGLIQLCFTEKTTTHIHYTEENGMPNNTIHGILEDKQGNIWVSTNKGIAKLNLSDKKIISFYQDDGLQSNEFADGAFYESKLNDYLYFGGIDGYNKFRAQDISEDYYVPKLNFGGLYINNIAADIDNYMKDGKLVLSSKDNLFGLSFTPVDYISGIKCEISYRIKNQSDEWIQMGSSRLIVFNKLPFGNYVLQVRYCNANKIWSEEIYELPIKILPPLWLTWQAVSIYVLLLIGIIYFIQRSVKNRVRIRHKLEINRLEKQKTEEIHQAKLRFFTNIAHEFCNSLTLIYSPAEQLQNKKGNDPVVKKHINTIKNNAERMNHLIQELMDFRKAETGFLELNIEQVDILELIRYTSDYFMYVAEQKNIQFKINCDEENIGWTTDRKSLEKICFNLLSNAFKYTPENGHIFISAKTENNTLIIAVQNSGKGIKESDQKHIFNRFKILEDFESDVLKGEARTGIGLALSQSLINLLKGEIKVDSKLNEFTTFTVALPYLNETASGKDKSLLKETPSERSLTYVKNEIEESAASEFPAEQIPGEVQFNEKPSILIVDDDAGVKDILYDILHAKYNLKYAKDGEEGYEIIRNNHFDLIICDIMMPKQNGIELIKKIKSELGNTSVPIIILSSLSSMDSHLEGLKTGADAYINKPFHSGFLELNIEQLLNKQKELRNYYNSPLSSMENYQGSKIRKGNKDFILKLTKIISDNINNENLSTEMLSNEMRVTKMQLYRKVKEIRNETPTEFIRFLRLEKVEKLLINTNKNIQEIIYECGFNNKAYFYQEFLKKNNMTPKEYRKNKKNTEK